MSTSKQDYLDHVGMVIIKMSQGLIKMSSVKDVSSCSNGVHSYKIIAHSTGYDTNILLNPIEHSHDGVCLQASSFIGQSVGTSSGLCHTELGLLKIKTGMAWANAEANATAIINKIAELGYLEY